MIKILKFLRPWVWLILAGYSITWLFDLMNTKSTLNTIIGTIGILLVIYLSIMTRLGQTFKYLKTIKTKKEDEKTND